MKINDKKNSKPKGKVTSKKKDQRKTSTIAVRLTTKDRENLDEVVKGRRTTITDYVTSVTKESIKKDQEDKRIKTAESVYQKIYDGKLYFKSYLDAIQTNKSNAELYAGAVGSIILTGIILKQLKK